MHLGNNFTMVNCHAEPSSPMCVDLLHDNYLIMI